MIRVKNIITLLKTLISLFVTFNAALEELCQVEEISPDDVIVM